MKQRFIRVGDELTDDVAVVVRGGDLDPGMLRDDALRNHAVYGTYGISVLAVRDLTLDELAQQPPLVGPWFLDRVAARLAAAHLEASYVILRPDREVALDRVQQRDGSAEASGAASMYQQFCALGEFERHVVMSDGPLYSVVEAVRHGLDESLFSLSTAKR